MDLAFQYRFMKPGEETSVSRFIGRVFNQFVAHQYVQEGIDAFYRYIYPPLIQIRCSKTSFVMVAVADGVIASIIEMRDFEHVALFFTGGLYQGRGVGGTLMKKAVSVCKKKRPDLSKVTVNASPNAVEIYKKLGFEKKDREQLKNGIRFVPMAYSLLLRKPGRLG